MSVTNRARRRVSLLASSSLVAASLLAGVAGLSSLAVAPGVALAADECGDPSANAGGNDVFVCSGAYAAIDYTTTTNGNLTLNMEDGVLVTGGVAATGNAGENLTVRSTTNVVGAGDPIIFNNLGYAINLQGQGASVIVDLRSSDVGVDGAPGPSIGTARGINATNSVGTVQVRMNEGEVNASAGFGINAVGVSGVVINLTNGTTVTSSGAAVRGVSSSGTVDIFTTGQITSDNTGIFASGADGAFVESGAVTGGAAGAGIQAQSSGGPAVVTTHGAVSGFQGIIANSGGGGASVVDLGGTVTGTGGAGVTQNVGATGSMILQSNGNAITGATNGVVQISSASSTVEAYLGDVTANAGNGVDVSASAAGALVVVSSTGLITASAIGVNVDTGGDATVLVNDVTAGTGYGVIVDAGGVATIQVSGAVTGAGGVAAQSGGASDATVNLLAGSTVEATDPFSYGAFVQATGTGDAFIIADGDVLDGGVGAFATSGTANVTGAGNISMLGAFDGVEAATTSGAINVSLTGDITSTGADGIDTISDTGVTIVSVFGNVTGGDNGIESTSNGGAITVNVGTGGVVTGVTNGVFAQSAGAGTALISITSGSVTGGNGASASNTGDGAAIVSIVSNGSAASNGAGYGATASTSGAGQATVSVDGFVNEGGVGVFATGTGGAFFASSGGVINDTGADAAVEVSTVTGVAQASFSSTITGGGDGVVVSSTGGTVIVGSAGSITVGGDGIEASNTTGTVVVSNAAAISAGANGITAGTTAGGVTVVGNSGAITGALTGYGILANNTAGGAAVVGNTGNIGTVGTPATAGGILAISTGGVGDVVAQSSVGSIFTDGSGAFGAGVAAVNGNTSGAAVATFQGIMDSGTVGVAAGVFNAANASGAVAIVSDGSTITAGTIGVTALNLGTGAATVSIGAGVTIDPNDYGVNVVSAANDATAVVGDNAVIVIGNTDGDNVAVGIHAESGRAADGVDAAVEVTLGVNGSITVDDGAGGDADGGAAILGEATGATGSVVIATGDGLNIGMTGNSAVGIAAQTVGGSVIIDVGTGTIDILGIDGVDTAGNFPGSAGLAGISATGNIQISSGAAISVNNGALLDAAGIFAQTGGSGSIFIAADAQVLSSDVGVSAESVDGNIRVVTNAFVGAVLGDGINATATGAGSLDIDTTASVTSVSGFGIFGSTQTGAIDIVANGPAVTAGFDGIVGVVGSAAAASNIIIDNYGDITANTTGLGGNGITAVNAGSGLTTVNVFNGFIAGTATSGVSASTTGAAGLLTVNYVGDGIGTAVNGVTSYGIEAVHGNAAATGGIVVTANGVGGIFAGDVGISAVNLGSGFVTVVTGSANPITTFNAGSDGIGARATGGLLQVANNAAITSAGEGIVATNFNGAMSVGSSGAIVATNDGIFTSNSGAGTSVVFTVAGGTINAGGDGMQVSTTGTGLIDIDVAAAIVAGNQGILASGGGVITVDTTAAGTVSGGTTGISASSTGGAVTVTTNGAVSSAGGTGILAQSVNSAVTVTSNAVVTGGAYGIHTFNTGTGVTTITANQNVTGSGVGQAGILAETTGTGAIGVTVGNGRTISGPNGSAIRTVSVGGAVTVNTGTNSLITGLGSGANGWVVDLNNAVGGTSTFNVGAGTVVRSGDNTITGYDDAVIRGIGGSVVINNAGRINGRVLFSGLTGNVVFNNSSLTSWHTTGTSTLSGGADVLNNTGAIFTNAGGVATTIDFGAGADTFTQAGLLVVGEPTLAASTLTLSNLETWNNSGRIVFGSSGTTMTAVSDGVIDDRILASGATFTGSGGSLLSMDANLGAVTQTSCAVLSAADCLSLTGGSTAGSTSILVNDTSGNLFGAFNPVGIVLVDVAGAGSTAATHFSLNAASDFWRADLNSPDGVLDKGLFFYDLTLNGNKQHVLVGLPDSEAFEFTTFGAALSSIWQTTTGVWFERQADLRDQLDSMDGDGAGVWMKITGSSAQRDRIQGYELFGVTYEFDTSYEQNTVALIGGLDFMGGGSGRSWVVGGQIGYVDSDVTYDNSPTLTSFEGMTFGVYGSYVSGPLFVDGIINANMLDYDHQAITLAPAGSNVFSGSVDTLGFQIEGGWTMPLGANGFFEPLGVLSYSSSDVDGLSVPGADIEFDDITSLRASLGGRIGVNVDHGTFSTKWAFVARYWNEFEGDNTVNFDSGPGFSLNDDFSGSFGEIGGTVNVFGADDRFSAFLNIGTKFQDDYQSVDGSLGLRWRW